MLQQFKPDSSDHNYLSKKMQMPFPLLPFNLDILIKEVDRV